MFKYVMLINLALSFFVAYTDIKKRSSKWLRFSYLANQLEAHFRDMLWHNQLASCFRDYLLNGYTRCSF